MQSKIVERAEVGIPATRISGTTNQQHIFNLVEEEEEKEEDLYIKIRQLQGIKAMITNLLILGDHRKVGGISYSYHQHQQAEARLPNQP